MLLFHISSDLILEPVTVKVTGSSFIEEGRRVEMVCSASSNLLDVSVTWSKDAKVLGTAKSRLTYAFPSIHRNDTGNYTCTTEVNGLSEERKHTTNLQVICKSV